jgi:hypothetical protein
MQNAAVAARAAEHTEPRAKATGRSARAAARALPGNSQRTGTHATRNPTTTLMRPATGEAPKLKRYEAATWGAEITLHKRSQLEETALRKTALSGTRTIKVRYRAV